MSVLKRLISLYSRSSDNSRTPLEDYTTEALAGILENNQNILDEFVNKVLEIDGEGFHLDTQKFYALLNDKNCRVDMVFGNEDTVCFLENKVESPEDHEQLDRYSKVLDLKKTAGKETFLRYCTKYFDKKNLDNHNFKQIRWADISGFLIKHENDSLIKDYLIFLRSNGMGESIKFSTVDLISMENIIDLVSRMNDCLELIKPKFKKIFGNKITEPDNIKQISTKHRYIFYKLNVFSEGGWNEIGVGFSFTPKPCLTAWMLCDKKNNKYNEFNRIINEKRYLKVLGDGCFGFSKPISDFLSDEKMFQSIEKWFIEKLNIIKQFTQETPELDWHLD